jgi:iron complex outermembrane receptor protein
VNTDAEQTTGRYLPKTPRLKVSLSPDLHARLANGAMLRLGVDFTHTAEIFNDVQNTWVIRRPKEDVVNLSAAIASPDGKASLTVGGTNLTDRRFITTGIQDDTRGVIYGDYSPPREWYATVGVKY